MIDSMKTTIRTASLGLIAAGPLLATDARFLKGDAAFFRAGPVSAAARGSVDAATRYQISSLPMALTHLLLAEMAAVGAVGYDTTVADLLRRRYPGVAPVDGSAPCSQG